MSELADEDDFTHYFNATRRLMTENDTLRTDNERLRAALVKSRDVLRDVVKMGGAKIGPLYSHALTACHQANDALGAAGEQNASPESE